MKHSFLLAMLGLNAGCEDGPATIPPCTHEELIETTLDVVIAAGVSVVTQDLPVKVRVSVPPDVTVFGVELGVVSAEALSLHPLRDITFPITAVADSTQYQTWLVNMPLDTLLAPLDVAPGATVGLPGQVFVVARPILNCTYTDEAPRAVGNSFRFLVGLAPPPPM